MRFKEYLTELNTQDGQIIKATDSKTLTDNEIRDELNSRLNHELTDMILSPESGIQRIRKVLHMFGLDMPALYDAEPDGDELILDVEQFDGQKQFYLYLIYYLADDGRYDFYAELTDDEGLEDIMSDEEEDEEE
jgi:hypothetical protein